MYLEKPAFIPSKPISHSPKISPSSIPNPSPSVSTSKQPESGYPNFGGYLYSIPGYSAFQPVSYPGMLQPNPAHIPQTQASATDYSFTSTPKEVTEEKKVEGKADHESSKVDPPKQQDFEENFASEIVPVVSTIEAETQVAESKMSITSLSQGSGATVTIPALVANKEAKKKVPERFSLKTSIPISKIDMKCVSNPPDAIFQNAMNKKVHTTFNPAFQSAKSDKNAKIEIQSNIVIKTAEKETETKLDAVKPISNVLQASSNNNISTLINAAETINKNDNPFWKPDPQLEVPNETNDPPAFSPQTPAPAPKPVFNPVTVEPNKVNFSPKPPDGVYPEQKNQILLIKNKNPSNPKMLLTIQQQNPQVLLQRGNFESKNSQAPSRLSGQIKKCKEEHINENGTSSKVVALKRLHQENCDENDFENLITENQIYGNKIVVKEKSQGTLQEQDLKKKGTEKSQETKNVVLQPNFVYLSNVQFPANLMMIKNNNKINQNISDSKTNKVASNENKTVDAMPVINVSESINISNTLKTQTVTVSKEIHVLKSSNNMLQSLAQKSTKADIVFQTANQKVIMNPQIVYQVPMIVDTDNKINQPFINHTTFVGQNKTEFTKPLDQTKTNDKLFIACPYQMDSKLQPKIVITNIRHKIAKVEEYSSLDMYEKRRKIRRLKYLSNRETKETQKPDANKKMPEKPDELQNIVTPNEMKAEIFKVFLNTKIRRDEENENSDSDYGEDELKEYNSIIEEYGEPKKIDDEKIEFLAGFRLATREAYEEKQLDRQERSLSKDAVASAYITVGRLDRLMKEDVVPKIDDEFPNTNKAPIQGFNNEIGDKCHIQRKQVFLSHLQLMHITPKYREEFENIWQEILKERKRRSGNNESVIIKRPKPEPESIAFDPMQLLTEIKKSVNENNNLIKKRLDSFHNDIPSEGDSIYALAEKNFSELNRLSKMADSSVKLFSGVDAKKRDLNPGFDSENIQKAVSVEQPYHNYPKIKIPSISKIISLKSVQEPAAMSSSKATSMDEPRSSAGGVDGFQGRSGRTQDVACQADEGLVWPGMDAIIKSYREFEAGQKRIVSELHRRNTVLRVECAHTTHAASRDADRARALLAERQNLAAEETKVRASVLALSNAVDVIRNYC